MSTVFIAEGMLESVETDTWHAMGQSGIRIGALVDPRSKHPSFAKTRASIQLRESPATELTIYTNELTEEALVAAATIARDGSGLALFVGEHCVERSRALSAGFDAAIPHPQLLFEVMSGHELRYAKISGLNSDYRDNRLTRFLNLPSVPIYLSAEKSGTAYIVTSTRIAEILRKMGFGVSVFGKHYNPQTTDLYLVRDDRTVPAGVEPEAYSRKYMFQEGTARYILDWVDNAVMMALDHKISIEDIHFPGAKHGHSLRLTADTGLIADQPLPASNPRSTQLFPAETFFDSRAFNTLTIDEIKALQEGIDDRAIDRLQAPYAGRTPLRVAGQEHLIQSRFLKHPQNKIVTAALMEHFKKIGDDLLKVEAREFELGGGQKYFNIEAELPGSEPDTIVIISAHFDSTSINSPDFDRAPGADDDASGMAGVLAAAEVAVRLRRENGPLKRTLRFVLFNAEEGGVSGSRKYAARQYSIKAKVEAVFQMDMIGFHGGEPTIFEIHAGYSYLPEIERKSLILAERVRKTAALLSPILINNQSPQIYSTKNGLDPAEGRSDHSRFHEYGYPAVMISEDYNTDPGDPSPDPHLNKDYHKSTDSEIDYVYAAEIARAVAGAAFLSAKN